MQASLSLHADDLPGQVMHLAAKILKADPSPNSTAISFDDAVTTPELISDTKFREFARLLDIAMPSWPALFVQSLLTPLLALAPLENLSICHHSKTDTWRVKVSRKDLEERLSGLAHHLGRAFTKEEREAMLWSRIWGNRSTLVPDSSPNKPSSTASALPVKERK